MNDTTLPIPSKKANSSRARRSPKTGVRKGFGLHDWMALCRHAKDLSQRKGAPIRRDITMEEVKIHNKPYDGWMVLRGKVYNITPYLAYHPGGSAILEKCLGRDGTALFDKYHRWVNLDGLIGPLLLGKVRLAKMRGIGEDDGEYLNENVAGVASISAEDGNNDIVVPAATATISTSSNDLAFAMPKPRPPKGAPIASLLPPDVKDDASEDDAMLL